MLIDLMPGFGNAWPTVRRGRVAVLISGIISLTRKRLEANFQ